MARLPLSDRGRTARHAKAYQCAGNTDSALVYFRKYDKLVPNQPEVREAIGKILVKQKQKKTRDIAASAIQSQRERNDQAVRLEQARKAQALDNLRADLSGLWRREDAVLSVTQIEREVTATFYQIPDGIQVSHGANVGDQKFHGYRSGFDELSGQLYTYHLVREIERCRFWTNPSDDYVTYRISRDGLELAATIPRKSIKLNDWNICEPEYGNTYSDRWTKIK